MTDFRALCAELANELQGYKVAHPMHCRALLNLARAALAQPEPQGPTDEELDEFAIYWWGPETDERLVSDVIEWGGMAAYARAVLARWLPHWALPVPGVEGA